MKAVRRRLLFCIGAAVIFFASQSAAAPADQKRVDVRLYDLELIDQDGKRARFRTDVIGDRLVAINFTYTTCTTICPVLDAIFINLQDLAGPRLGKDIVLITISIDPVTDIPARLKQHSIRLRARPGWRFLTGKKQDVDKVLTGLDVYTPDLKNHPPAVFVGDGRKNVWRRLYGFPSAEKIMGVLNELDKARR